MTPDSLDDLLGHSSPRTAAAPRLEIEAMIADARREVPVRRRVPRIALGVGLAALLVGGAGVATASSVWDWNSGTSDPNRSYAYTSPTWGSCELRFGDFVASNPLLQIELDHVIDEWFSSTDIESQTAPLVDKHLAQLQRDQLGDSEVVKDPRLPDLNYWIASDQAVGELLDRELRAHGFDAEKGDGVASGASQVHCAGEQW